MKNLFTFIITISLFLFPNFIFGKDEITGQVVQKINMKFLTIFTIKVIYKDLLMGKEICFGMRRG